jgi:hypothetical protein
MTKLDKSVMSGTHCVVRREHEVGERVDPGEPTDRAIVGDDVSRPTGAKQIPVPLVDAGGVTDQHLADLSLVLTEAVHADRD